jgi:hypothetical protein
MMAYKGGAGQQQAYHRLLSKNWSISTILHHCIVPPFQVDDKFLGFLQIDRAVGVALESWLEFM